MLTQRQRARFSCEHIFESSEGGFGGKSIRLGTDVMYQGKVHLRAGYVGHDRRGDASASLGFGLQSGSFVFDIARTFGGLPADNGQTPVYVSLRYLF